MKKILGVRASGLTTELVKKSSETGAYIVCHYAAVSSIEESARAMDLKIPQPITYDEFINKKYEGKTIKGFLIDDADYLLKTMTSVEIDVITMTITEDDDLLTTGLI